MGPEVGVGGEGRKSGGSVSFFLAPLWDHM